MIELAVVRGHERLIPAFVAEVWGLELPVFRRRRARYPVLEGPRMRRTKVSLD